MLTNNIIAARTILRSIGCSILLTVRPPTNAPNIARKAVAKIPKINQTQERRQRLHNPAESLSYQIRATSQACLNVSSSSEHSSSSTKAHTNLHKANPNDQQHYHIQA